MRFSPILLFKRAIFRKKPQRSTYMGKCFFERMSESNNKLLSERYFAQKLKYGYDGFLVYNDNSDLIGYYWYMINQSSITSIPKIPKDSPWVFNMFVFKNFRGNGYQKEMFKHFEAEFHCYRYVYGDVLLDNIPSLKSFLTEDYKECGFYYIFIFGVRSIKYLNFKLGYWDKSEKHIYNI